MTQEIPLVTGQYTNSTAAVNGTTSPFQTIQREEVGTILKVTPHISEGDTIQLKVEQEDSSPGAKLAELRRHLDQQALDQDHHPDRGRRHHRARRPDAGHRHRKRGSRTGARRDPAARQPVQIAHQAPARRATCLCSCARRSCATSLPTEAISDAKYNEIREEETVAAQGQDHLAAGREAARDTRHPQRQGAYPNGTGIDRRPGAPACAGPPSRCRGPDRSRAAAGTAGLAAGSRAATGAGRPTCSPALAPPRQPATGPAAMSAELRTAGRATQAVLSVRQASRRPGARHRRPARPTRCAAPASPRRRSPRCAASSACR